METFLTYVIMPLCFLVGIISAKLLWRSPFGKKQMVKEITLKDLNENSRRSQSRLSTGQRVKNKLKAFIPVSVSSSEMKSSPAPTTFGLDSNSNNYSSSSSGFNSCDGGSCGE